jgi:hypothetical protein
MPNEISNNVVLVMNSTAITTRGTWVQFKKVGGSDVLPQVGCGHKKKKKTKKMFPFLMMNGGLPGTGTQLMLSYSGCTLELVSHVLAVME